MNLGRTPRTDQPNRDFWRRPELNVDIDPTSSSVDGYQRMMKSLTVAGIDARQKEKHSEFEKPYIRGIKYDELQSFHPSNWIAPYLPPGVDGGGGGGEDGEDGGEDGGDGISCEEAWSNCLKILPKSCFNCGIPQKAEDCMSKQGVSFGNCKKHIIIFDCLFFNSICFCEKCKADTHDYTSYIDCDTTQDEKCQELICSDEPCPPFVLNGLLTAPAVLCPSTEICASKIEGGTPQDKCVAVPDEGCGMKNVCVTDACGNKVCVEVKMSGGAWFQIGHFCIGDAFGCAPNPDYPTSKTDCNPTLLMCSEIEGGSKFERFSGNSNEGAGPPCPKCGNNQAYSNYYKYEWRCI